MEHLTNVVKVMFFLVIINLYLTFIIFINTSFNKKG